MCICICTHAFIHRKSKFFSAPKNQLSPEGDIAPIENKQIVRCVELEGDLSTAGNTKDFCIPCSNPGKRGGERLGPDERTHAGSEQSLAAG